MDSEPYSDHPSPFVLGESPATRPGAVPHGVLGAGSRVSAAGPAGGTAIGRDAYGKPFVTRGPGAVGATAPGTHYPGATAGAMYGHTGYGAGPGAGQGRSDEYGEEGDPEDPDAGYDGAEGDGYEDYDDDEGAYGEYEDEEDELDVSRLGFDARSHRSAETDVEAGDEKLNVVGRCMRALSGCRCTPGHVFAIVWTILQLIPLIITLIPATVLVVLFGLVYRGPEIIFKAYVAMSISKRVGCNVRVLFFVLFPIAFLLLLCLAPAFAGLAMLSFVVTKTYIVNSTDVVQFQRTSILHTFTLLFAGLVAPCSDFVRQSQAFLLAISHGVFEMLHWLGDQRPNRKRVWPEPFETRVDWFLISLILSFVFGPIQAVVFFVFGVVAYLPGIVTSVRRVYADPEHFGLGFADIQASPGRAVVAFFGLLLLPVTSALGVAALPFVGLAVGVKSAFVAFWTTQIGWNGGPILWNDFGAARFSLPPKRRDSFTEWQEEQAQMAAEAAEQAVKEMEDAAAAAAEAGAAGADADRDGGAGEPQYDDSPAAKHDSGSHAGAGEDAIDASGEEDPTDTPVRTGRAGADSKALGSSSGRGSSPGGLSGKVTVGRTPNNRLAGPTTVVIPFGPGLPRAANLVSTRPHPGSASASAAPTAPHLSAKRKAQVRGFDYAADPVITPGSALQTRPRFGALPASNLTVKTSTGADTGAAAGATAGATAGASVGVAVSPATVDKPPLPRGCTAALIDLRDDQGFLARVMAITILDIPFEDHIASPCTGCGRSPHSSGVIAAAVFAGVVSGLVGVITMPVFGAIWAVITFVPCLVRIVVSFVNPAMYPKYPEEDTRLAVAIYYLGKWPLYVLTLLLLPVPMLVLLVFYVAFCLVEGARVGPMTAADSLDDSPMARSFKALGRTMREHDHAVFRFIHDKVGTSEVPFTLIGYSLSLMCDDVDGPSAAEQSFLDRMTAHNLHNTTTRQRLQGGMATADGIRSYDPTRPGARSILAPPPMAASFYAPQAEAKTMGTKKRSRKHNKPRKPEAVDAAGGDAKAPALSNPLSTVTEEEPAAGDPVSEPRNPASGAAKAAEPAASEAAPPERERIPKSKPCCPCCDPDSWEDALTVRETPKVTQETFDDRRRREAVQEEARIARVEAATLSDGEDQQEEDDNEEAEEQEEEEAGDAIAGADAGVGAALSASAAKRLVAGQDDDEESYDSGSSDDLDDGDEDDEDDEDEEEEAVAAAEDEAEAERESAVEAEEREVEASSPAAPGSPQAAPASPQTAAPVVPSPGISAIAAIEPISEGRENGMADGGEIDDEVEVDVDDDDDDDDDDEDIEVEMGDGEVAVVQAAQVAAVADEEGDSNDVDVDIDVEDDEVDVEDDDDDVEVDDDEENAGGDDEVVPSGASPAAADPGPRASSSIAMAVDALSSPVAPPEPAAATRQATVSKASVLLAKLKAKKAARDRAVHQG